MHSRLLGFAAMAGAALLVACTGDPAGPTLNLTAATTSGIVIRDSMDQSLTAVPAYVADTGLVRFNLYKKGDTTLVISLTTPSSGGGRISAAQRGIIRFYGIAPGTYVIRPALRALSSASSTSSTTPQLGDSAVVTVTAGNIDSTSVFKVRLGASLASVLAVQWLDTAKLNIVRLPGVTVQLQRETVAGSGIYVDVAGATSVTDPTGAFTIPLASTGGSMGTRLRTTFTTSASGVSTTIPDQAQLNLGGFVAPPGTPGATFPGAAVWTQVGTAGNSTNQNISIGTVGTAAAPFSYQFSSLISGRVYRDLNANGTYDGVAEDLVAGDTVVVQLRNNAGTRVITTSRALTTVAASYSFVGLQGNIGSYKLTMDLLTSRINGKRPTVSPSITVALATSSTRYTQTPVAPALPNPIDVGVALPP